MENKVLYNLDKIISVYVYKKKVNRWFEDFKPDFATKEALYKQFNP